MSATMQPPPRVEDDQHQSPFLSRLPPEIRNAIYLELWRTAGLSQHVFWHEDADDPAGSRYRLWPCAAGFVFGVEDEREPQLEALWEAKGSPGTWLDDGLWHGRLASHWYNHWGCEEELLRQAGLDANRMPARMKAPTAQLDALRSVSTVARKPYLPMLLSCKRLYRECLASIYESTTFVFVDLPSIRKVFRRCAGQNAPAQFLKHVRKLDVSLPIVFPKLVSCYSLSGGAGPGAHSPYDFHWLHLGDLENCRRMNVWIDARRRGIASFTYYKDRRGYIPVNEMDADALRHAFSALGEQNPRCSITITTPLRGAIEPESGFVPSLAPHPRVRVWKRHAGDKFHPLRPTESAPQGPVFHISARPQRDGIAGATRFFGGFRHIHEARARRARGEDV